MGGKLTALLLVLALLAETGCISLTRRGREMEAMVKRATYSDVVERYGPPFDTFTFGREFFGYWKDEPTPHVTKGCFGDEEHCLTCNRHWIIYELKFSRDTGLLLKAGWDWPNLSRSIEAVSEMPTFGMKAEDCMKNKECRKRAEEACRRTVEAGMQGFVN